MAAQYRLEMILFVCYWCLNFASGSSIQFQVTPLEVQNAVTENLSVRCSLTSSTVTSVPPVTSNDLVGRSADDDLESVLGRRASGVEQIDHVTSITISRNGEIIATVSPYTKAIVESSIDLVNAKVSGDVTGNDQEKGYLQLSWSFPTSAQTGQYVCTVAGVTRTGHAAPVLTQTVLVRAADVSGDDLLDELRDLKQLVYQQRNITLQQKEAHVRELQAANAKIASLQTTVTQLTRTVSLLGHTEQGDVDCGESSSWKDGTFTASWIRAGKFAASKSVRVNFKSAYAHPPVVQLSVVGFVNNQYYEGYGAVLEQVDTAGFTLRCGTYREGDYHVYDMDITWTSVPTM